MDVNFQGSNISNTINQCMSLAFVEEILLSQASHPSWTTHVYKSIFLACLEKLHSLTNQLCLRAKIISSSAEYLNVVDAAVFGTRNPSWRAAGFFRRSLFQPVQSVNLAALRCQAPRIHSVKAQGSDLIELRQTWGKGRIWFLGDLLGFLENSWGFLKNFWINFEEICSLLEE